MDDKVNKKPSALKEDDGDEDSMDIDEGQDEVIKRHNTSTRS